MAASNAIEFSTAGRGSFDALTANSTTLMVDGQDKQPGSLPSKPNKHVPKQVFYNRREQIRDKVWSGHPLEHRSTPKKAVELVFASRVASL